MRTLLLLLTIFTVNVHAQSVEDSVKRPILQLFEGMKRGDSMMLKNVFAPTASLETIAKDKTGKTVVRTEEISGFITAVSKPHTEVYDERISFETIKIDGDLAIVWTPYKFYVGEKFSHCGVNSIQLVRLNGEWKIQYIIDTRRKENCK